MACRSPERRTLAARPAGKLCIMLTRSDLDDLKRTFIPADESPYQDDVPMDDIPSATSLADFGLSPDAGGDGYADGVKVLPAEAAPLTLICPPAWRDVPLELMRWL